MSYHTGRSNTIKKTLRKTKNYVDHHPQWMDKIGDCVGRKHYEWLVRKAQDRGENRGQIHSSLPTTNRLHIRRR